MRNSAFSRRTEISGLRPATDKRKSRCLSPSPNYGDAKCVIFILETRSLLTEVVFIQSVTLESNGRACRIIQDIGPGILDRTVSLNPGNQVSSMVSFVSGRVRQSQKRSIFDTTFT